MINKKLFGKTKDGNKVYSYLLKTEVAEVSILTYGATCHTFKCTFNGETIDTVLGYDNVESYENLDGSLGALVGRNSNRIKDGEFNLSGTLYKLPLSNNWNNLHSGEATFYKQIFDVTEVNEKENSITLSYFSKDMEGGFPGNLNFKVKYTLVDASLSMEYFAISDKNTIMNPTNHSYFNLGCNVVDTVLQINSSFFTVVDEHLHTTGEIASVKGTAFDFTSAKTIGKDIDSNNQQLKFMGGYDVNYCLSTFNEYQKVVTATNPNNGLTLNVYTDRPAVQLYTSNFLTKRLGKEGKYYDYREGFCLETQTYSGAANNPHFPTPFIKANEEFYSKTTYELILK